MNERHGVCCCEDFAIATRPEKSDSSCFSREGMDPAVTIKTKLDGEEERRLSTSRNMVAVLFLLLACNSTASTLRLVWNLLVGLLIQGEECFAGLG